jgi:tRNA(Ile)-lysidine synthase
LKEATQSLEAVTARYPELSPDSPALIGVSGGRDSICLMHFLAKAEWSQLVVCHLNHGLRGNDSDGDENFVREAAISLGLKFESVRVDVSRKAASKKISTELAGREVREAFFLKMARKHLTRFVFLAHHLDDQAETVIGNLFRGTGLAGLAGMSQAMETHAGLVKVRPLLSTRRCEIDTYLKSHGIGFREDASNSEPIHRRNRIRNELLPLINEIFGRDVTPILHRVSSQSERDHLCLDEMARDFARFHGLFQEDGSLLLTDEFRDSDPAIQSRILLGLLVDVNGCAQISSHEIELALRLLKPNGPAKINLPEGKHLRRKALRLWVESPSP